MAEGIWYAGSTDTFSFADDPDKAKGIVVLDTVTGQCRHIPLTGQRPLVTLESVYAWAFRQRSFPSRSCSALRPSPKVPSPGFTWKGSTPRPTGCSTASWSVRSPAAALDLRLEPQFLDVSVPAELPRVETLGGQWDSWLSHQDLTGLDRRAGAGPGPPVPRRRGRVGGLGQGLPDRC